ncbi:PEGA domain-containing protein [Blastochloris viridis]|uniref:PEGA domain-containing protein n=1 Tax=Blastochloris viridis TaxID=1079 RepID=A0A0H5B7N7_BLAVI|nr:PEGA domain-containing protein [Blastochloris viridis]ALK08523.1 hypothetical protein BVIR_729 [Blastochloris viridis]BAR98190.1 hypothetical protein BV133_597 [Blastochloris viridis]CUU41185.1 hypothetical protein BVIRIDIS_01730 [Blastochloris viridis]
MRIHLIAMMTVGVALGGCAGLGGDLDAGNIFGPSTAEIQVASEPEGAQARTSTGESCPSTPCTIKVPASAEQYVVTVSKPGFIDQTADVHWTVMGEGSEAQRQLYPNPVEIVLEPAPPPPPSKKKPSKKHTAAL